MNELISRARRAQAVWRDVPIKQRAKILLDLREAILDQRPSLVRLIAAENGKPEFEALLNDVFPVVESLTFFGRRGYRALQDHSVRIHNPIFLHRKSVLNYWPVGVVAVISPWNYPFFLPFTEVLMALLAGNAVLLKPSEVTPKTGLAIVSLCKSVGLPDGLVECVQGDGSVGARLIEARPDKIFFTGSVATGYKVLEAAARLRIPVNLELGGKDPLIVLSDADLDFATSAALFGAFSNSGQACASIERVLVDDRIHDAFASLLQQKLSTLRQGDPAQGPMDLGLITYPQQREVYRTQLADARARGFKIQGGEWGPEEQWLSPTLITGDGIEPSLVYREETFGPVLPIVRFKTTLEAIEKANDSHYGLTACIVSKDLVLAESLARRLEFGTVMINEVQYTAAVPETPWGGVKDTGLGRKHTAEGLRDYCHVRHIHSPRFRFLSAIKALWWFPYSPHQTRTFTWFLELYRLSAWKRAYALSRFIPAALRFLFKEPRI